MKYVNDMWLETLKDITQLGRFRTPRGKLTLELPQRTVIMNMKKPVLTVLNRKLSYQFMAAEAYWILSGDDSVAGIEEYNARIVEFSDDGRTFFGAYGPRIKSQLDYVVSKLLQDPDTRQAGLTIWRENPPETKDVPCTVSIFFSIADGHLQCYVFMRSSDAWLGLPYDVFNFSMLSCLVCSRLNKERDNFSQLQPGALYLTAASMHLYEEQFVAAREVLKNPDYKFQRRIPDFLYHGEDGLMTLLRDLRTSKPGSPSRWWEVVNYE